MSPEDRLLSQKLVLPEPLKPGATYVTSLTHGNLLYLAGHLGIDLSRRVVFNGRERHPAVVGTVGGGLTLEQACQAARGGALNLVATMKAALNDLERVQQIIRVTCMVVGAPGFDLHHKVADAASDLLVELFGERGRHTRAAIGVAGLPIGACVEFDAIVAFR